MDGKFHKYSEEPVCYEDAHNTSRDTKVSSSKDAKSELDKSTPSSLDDDSDTKCLSKAGCTEKKEKMPKMPLIKIWIVLVLTLLFAIVLLVSAHLSHCLTLRLEAYHALYNLMALTGCLVTIKVSEKPVSVKNTFGWARVELLSCLFTLIFIGSFCFSITLEAMQTAAHSGHQDTIHHALPLIALAGIGLLLNAVVFYLIGGYTHHQGCFLEQRSSGVYAQGRVEGDAVQSGRRSLVKNSHRQSSDSGGTSRTFEGAREVLRDISGLLIVIVCAAIVLWGTNATLDHYIDPVFAVFSAAVLIYLSYPYGKECCQILLQTIPGNINVQTLSSNLLQEFPEVVNVHHLHIWSLTPGKVVATAHVVYSNPSVYRSSNAALEKFFIDKEITQVTLQPEFVHFGSSANPSEVGSNECLLRCENDFCRQKECCDDREIEDTEKMELMKITIEKQEETSTRSEITMDVVSSTEEKDSTYQQKTSECRRFSLDSSVPIPVHSESIAKGLSKEKLINSQNSIQRSFSCINFSLEM